VEFCVIKLFTTNYKKLQLKPMGRMMVLTLAHRVMTKPTWLLWRQLL